MNPQSTLTHARCDRKIYDLTKRVIDLLLALCLIWIAVPVIAVCAVLITLDSPGPAFFLQERTGIGGRRFKLIKLRTMIVNAIELKPQFEPMNELGYPDFKIANDPRVTRIGAFLRRTSIDELPNVFNILLGHMSFVGPRPTSFPAEAYATWQTARLRVLPGLTGLWQVSGRSEIDFEDRVRMDIRYIAHRSLWLDIVLLAKTVRVVIRGKGAY